MIRSLYRLVWMSAPLFLTGSALFGQPRPGWDRGPGGQPPPMQGNRPPMERNFHSLPPGKWWTDPALAQRLGLNADQQTRMDSIFQQSRLKLIDLNAALQKEEAIMEPLLEAEHPDEVRVVAQIDRIAQARAELEKANARMLLGFRATLSQDQWKKLQDFRPQGFGRSRPDGHD